MEKYTEIAMDFLAEYGPEVAKAIIALVIGLWLISKLTNATAKVFEKKEFDKSLESFLLSMMGISLKLMLVISVAGMIGIKTTSFMAILGAAGLAIGLALQGSLSNFAGSVLILLFKPFKVGELVELDGRVGTVKEIQLFATIMTTLDNKTVILPNGPLAGGTIINLSREPIKRIDLSFGISYDDDLKKAKEVLNNILKEDTRVLDDPSPVVAVSELGDNSVNFVFRPWVKTEDFWDVYFDMTEAVKLRFDKEGLSFPYPQHDVHLYKK